jgi:hypothetical protein
MSDRTQYQVVVWWWLKVPILDQVCIQETGDLYSSGAIKLGLDLVRLIEHNIRLWCGGG